MRNIYDSYNKEKRIDVYVSWKFFKSCFISFIWIYVHEIYVIFYYGFKLNSKTFDQLIAVGLALSSTAATSGCTVLSAASGWSSASSNSE